MRKLQDFGEILKKILSTDTVFLISNPIDFLIAFSRCL